MSSCRATNAKGSGVKEDPKTVTPEDKPRQTWKVRPACGGEWLHVERLDELGDCDDGNEYELVSVWLTQKEIDALPDDLRRLGVHSCGRAPLDGAQKCKRAFPHNEEMVCMCCNVGYALARVAELEAERDRMRPVVSAAVKYDAALREYSERGDDDPEFQRPVTIAESALTEAVTAYLAATPKEPR